jgi:hypothetical protein
MNLYFSLHNYCAVWLKFEIKYLRILLLKSTKFRENCPWEGVNEIIFTRNPCNHMSFESEGRLVKVCVLRHSVHYLQSCYNQAEPCSL